MCEITCNLYRECSHHNRILSLCPAKQTKRLQQYNQYRRRQERQLAQAYSEKPANPSFWSCFCSSSAESDPIPRPLLRPATEFVYTTVDPPKIATQRPKPAPAPAPEFAIHLGPRIVLFSNPSNVLISFLQPVPNTQDTNRNRYGPANTAAMGFGDLFRSSKGPKRPSSSRMPTDCVPSSSSASRPHTSASSKLGRRGAIKSDHSSSGHCAGRIQNTPWVRPGTGYRQVQPTDMASGIPPVHIPMPSSSSHRPRVSPRGPHQPDPLLAGNEAYPVDLSSVSGGFGVPIAATRTVPVSHVPVHTPTYVDYHAPAPTPAYVYGPLPPVPLSRSSGHRPRISTGSSSYASSGYHSSSSSCYSSSNTSYPPSSHTSSSRSQASSSHRPSHKHHSKRETQYEPERDAYEVSPLDAAFPPEVQRVLDRGFSSAASLGVSRNVPQVSTRGPSRNPSTAASSSSRSFAARAAEAQFAFDIGGYGPRTNHFVSPCYQPSYTSNSTGAYYNEGGLF